MKEPDFRDLIDAIGDLADNAMRGRRCMQEVHVWIREVFCRIRESDFPEQLKEAWRRLTKAAKDRLGIELLAKEIDAVIAACRRAIGAPRKAEKRDVLNAVATLMDSLKKDIKLPASIEITWNAAREAVDVAKG